MMGVSGLGAGAVWTTCDVSALESALVLQASAVSAKLQIETAEAVLISKFFMEDGL